MAVISNEFWSNLVDDEQNIEHNIGRKVKKLLERKIGGNKSRID